MTSENFSLAISVIIKSHSTKMVVNHVDPNGQVSPVLTNNTIHILNCCPAVINELREFGFSFSMDANGLEIMDYSVK